MKHTFTTQKSGCHSLTSDQFIPTRVRQPEAGWLLMSCNLEYRTASRRYWGFPDNSLGKESACNTGDPGSGRSPGKGIGYPLQCSWASLVAQLVKNPACNEGDLGSIPGLGRSSGEEKGYPLQYSGLENSMDSPWGRKESDTTERLSLSLSHIKLF